MISKPKNGDAEKRISPAVARLKPGLKHLKSSLEELRNLFERAVTVQDIAEPLISFDANQKVEGILEFMEARNFDIVGIRDQGLVVGYINRADFKDGPTRVHLHRFDMCEILPDNAPLSSAVKVLGKRPAAFVTTWGQVGGIITRGDLQKAPIRMWLFGLISLLEMQMLRLIRERYPNDSWTARLSASRAGKAHDLFKERKRRNEEVYFSDCLCLADKGTIFLKDEALFNSMGLASRSTGEHFFGCLEGLRNALAHAQDINARRWPEWGMLAIDTERLLEKLETAAFSSSQVAGGPENFTGGPTQELNR